MAVYVALRKESVDRNMLCTSVCFVCVGSLSARRAWIEMVDLCLSSVLLHVALRKESVDRNHICNPTPTHPSMSLSARRAWIEIPKKDRQSSKV